MESPLRDDSVSVMVAGKLTAAGARLALYFRICSFREGKHKTEIPLRTIFGFWKLYGYVLHSNSFNFFLLKICGFDNLGIFVRLGFKFLFFYEGII